MSVEDQIAPLLNTIAYADSINERLDAARRLGATRDPGAVAPLADLIVRLDDTGRKELVVWTLHEVERINLQHDGRHAKPYQVKQVRAVLLKYKVTRSED